MIPFGVVGFTSASNQVGAGAGLYLSSRSKHPHVESSTNLRKDPVPEERSSMPEEGAAHKESVGRRTTRSGCMAPPHACLSRAALEHDSVSDALQGGTFTSMFTP